MSVIKLETKDQLLYIKKPHPIITSGNKNNDYISIEFDETWDCENGKFFASFYINNIEDAHSRELTIEDERCYSCCIPNEMLVKEGFFRFGVWCETEGKRKTSEVKKMIVHQGAVTDSNPPTKPENGGSSGGSSGGNIDLSNYVTKDMMPEIDVDEVVERTARTEIAYTFEADKNPAYWVDNSGIDPFGSIVNQLYPTCVTPEIYLGADMHYKITGNCYESEIYQYGADGFIENTSISLDGLFKVHRDAQYVRLVVPKLNNVGEEIDLNETVEYFCDTCKIYTCNRYKLKENVDLPDNVKLPDSDYVLTEADKTEIAEKAVEIIDTALLELIG